MLMIRLSRVGRKHEPAFRIVLTDRRNSAKSGKFLEVLGSYDARRGNPEIMSDRVAHWLKMGAQPTETVRQLLKKHALITK